MNVQPYLDFNGSTEEALAFYQKAIGAKPGMVLRFKDSPEKPPEGCMPADPNKIMHAEMMVGDALVMLSDGMGKGRPDFKGFSLTLTAKDDAEADKLFAALGVGGQVQMPLGKTFFSPRFGMVADKFGVSWMVIVLPKEALQGKAA